MLHRVISGLLDIIYPKICPVCKNKLYPASANRHVCASCWDKIKRNLPPFCYSCGRQLKNLNFRKNICPNCLKNRLHFDRAYSPCVYEGNIKELIHAFKYKGKDYLGEVLSTLMIEFIKEYDIPIQDLDFIIPVPLHKTRLREREFNQAEILSKQIAKEFKKDLLADALIRHRYTKTQTGLEIHERLNNVKGSFSVNKKYDFKNRNTLLIDDVLTSGATASEAAYALKDSGANIVFVLTLAN